MKKPNNNEVIVRIIIEDVCLRLMSRERTGNGDDDDNDHYHTCTYICIYDGCEVVVCYQPREPDVPA